MKLNPTLAIILSLLLFFLPACATYQARQALESLQKHWLLNSEAWLSARVRLKAMCPMPMHTTKAVTDALYETYRAMDKKIDPDIAIMAQAVRDIGDGKLNIDVFKEKLEGHAVTGGDRSCNIRIVKATNAPVSNDWQWDWLPSYQTIVAVHEEELRKRVTPRLYEEYMLGLSRFLCKAADEGMITPQQLVETFNAGWNYMVSAMKNEAALLVNDFEAARLSDAQTWKTIGEIAAGMAAVATAVLVASAAASAQSYVYVPAPTLPPPRNVHCEARRYASTIYVDCYQ